MKIDFVAQIEFGRRYLEELYEFIFTDRFAGPKPDGITDPRYGFRCHKKVQKKNPHSSSISPLLVKVFLVNKKEKIN